MNNGRHITKAEIITIGDELLYGHTVDTNAAYISETVTSAGAQVIRRTTVGDNVDDITEAIARAMHRAELVITTGGLGPTNDDLTKKAICKYFKRPLIFHDDILRLIENRFKARGITMPAINQNQALLPQGAEFIENELGSAVGIAIEEEGRLFVSTPGVPDEMKPMISSWVAAAIRRRSGSLVTLHRKIRTVGILESALYEKVIDLLEGKNIGAGEEKISVAFLPSMKGVDIRLSTLTRNEKDGRRKIDELEAKILERADKYIYGFGDDTLAETVGRMLKERKATLAVAESCTGGLLGKIITDIPGSSDYFLGGVIAYSNDLKIRLLSVPEEVLMKHGAVSEECARHMADGARKSLGATVAVSITGIAGPSGGTEQKPVGLTYIGLSAADYGRVSESRFGKDRERNRERCAVTALDIVRRYLLGELK